MGFNTTVVLLNDHLHEIRDDRDFGEKLYHATLTVGRQVPIARLPGATVVESHHADCSAIVAVGGNCATVLGTWWGYNHQDPDTQINILRYLAEERGYRLTKKRKA